MTPARSLPLEEFGGPDDVTDAGPSPDYVSGFADGHAAGLTEAAEAQTALRHALVAALEDIAFTQAEARQQVLAALRPVLTQLAESVVPDMIAQGFAHRIAAALDQTLTEGAAGPLVLHLAPGQVDSVAATLADLGSPKTDIRPDPALLPDQARIGGWDSETFIDLPALTSALAEALRGLDPQERTENHG